MDKIARNGKSSTALIFRYADWQDILLMLLGTLGAIGDGLSTNCLLVYVSHLFNSLGYYGKTQENHYNFMAEVEKVSKFSSSMFPHIFNFFLSSQHPIN